MKFDIKFTSIIGMLICFFNSYAQISYVRNSCFCVEEANAQPNIIYRYNVLQQNWEKMGAVVYAGGSPVLTERVEAIAINPVENIIYAIDGNKFGTIDPTTNLFTLINSSLSGDGVIQGQVWNNFAFGDIDGLTYNPYTRELWGTNRLSGNTSNDILFKIDPTTGAVIQGVFGAYDFVEIEESYDSTFGGDVFNVDDIAINPFTNEMFAIQNQNGPGIVTIIDRNDGSIENNIYDFNEDHIEGLGFSGYGILYGSTGDESDLASSLIAIDFHSRSTSDAGIIDDSLPNGVGDFESFDCVSDYVDLALDAKTINQGVFSIGDIVEIDVTIYNQGTIEIDKLEMTTHLATGLTLISNGWLNAGGQKRKNVINSSSLPLQPNTSFTLKVKLRLDNPALASYSIPFEISNAQNNIINYTQKAVINLPDVDSTPDYLNNETNTKNNEINLNGKFNAEDEDDHDIANFSVSNCPLDLMLSDIDESLYNAEYTIHTNGEVDSDEVELYAGHAITFASGFEIEVGEELFADIEGCP